MQILRAAVLTAVCFAGTTCANESSSGTMLRGSSRSSIMSGNNDTRIGARRSLAPTSVGEFIDETWRKVLLDTVEVTVDAKFGAEFTFDPSSCDYELQFSSGTMEWQLNFLKPILGMTVDPVSGGFPELLNAEGDKKSGEIVFTLNAPVSFPSPLDGSFEVKVIFRKDDEDPCCFQHWSVYLQAKVTTAIERRVGFKVVTVDGPSFESEESKIKEFELDTLACGQTGTTTTQRPTSPTSAPTEPTLAPTPEATFAPSAPPTPATTQDSYRMLGRAVCYGHGGNNNALIGQINGVTDLAACTEGCDNKVGCNSVALGVQGGVQYCFFYSSTTLGRGYPVYTCYTKAPESPTPAPTPATTQAYTLRGRAVCSGHGGSDNAIIGQINRVLDLAECKHGCDNKVGCKSVAFGVSGGVQYCFFYSSTTLGHQGKNVYSCYTKVEA